MVTRPHLTCDLSSHLPIDEMKEMLPAKWRGLNYPIIAPLKRRKIFPSLELAPFDTSCMSPKMCQRLWHSNHMLWSNKFYLVVSVRVRTIMSRFPNVPHFSGRGPANGKVFLMSYTRYIKLFAQRLELVRWQIVSTTGVTSGRRVAAGHPGQRSRGRRHTREWARRKNPNSSKLSTHCRY